MTEEVRRWYKPQERKPKSNVTYIVMDEDFDEYESEIDIGTGEDDYTCFDPISRCWFSCFLYREK